MMATHLSQYQRAQRLTRLLAAKISSSNPEILKRFPVEEYVDCFNRFPKCARYNLATPEIQAKYDAILMSSDLKVLETYQKMVLTTLIIQAKRKNSEFRITDSSRKLFLKEFNRILSDIEEDKCEEGSYLYPNDKFYKDLGICNLKIIPVGLARINLARLPRRFILKHGFRQFLKGVWLITAKLKGVQPFFDYHTDSRDKEAMSRFGYEGWVEFFKRVAVILELNTEIKGIFGISWFFDPQLAHVSPRLAYLRTMIIENGGFLFKTGVSEGHTRSALLKSPTRRKLHREGKYQPLTYLAVWPRQALIAWAQNVH